MITEEIKLKVMRLEGVDTFIYHVNGKVTITALVDIEKELLEYEEEILERGDGLYSLSCNRNEGEYTDYGQCIYKPYWDFYVESYEGFKE